MARQLSGSDDAMVVGKERKGVSGVLGLLGIKLGFYEDDGYL